MDIDQLAERIEEHLSHHDDAGFVAHEDVIVGLMESDLETDRNEFGKRPLVCVGGVPILNRKVYRYSQGEDPEPHIVYVADVDDMQYFEDATHRYIVLADHPDTPIIRIPSIDPRY